MSILFLQADCGRYALKIYPPTSMVGGGHFPAPWFLSSGMWLARAYGMGADTTQQKLTTCVRAGLLLGALQSQREPPSVPPASSTKVNSVEQVGAKPTAIDPATLTRGGGATPLTAAWRHQWAVTLVTATMAWPTDLSERQVVSRLVFDKHRIRTGKRNFANSALNDLNKASWCTWQQKRPYSGQDSICSNRAYIPSPQHSAPGTPMFYISKSYFFPRIPWGAHFSLISDQIFTHVQKRSWMRKVPQIQGPLCFLQVIIRFGRSNLIFKYGDDLLKTPNTNSIIDNLFLCIDGEESSVINWLRIVTLVKSGSKTSRLVGIPTVFHMECVKSSDNSCYNLQPAWNQEKAIVSFKPVSPRQRTP